MVSKEKKDFFCLAQKNKNALYRIIYKELIRRYILMPKIVEGKTQQEVLDAPLEIVVGNIYNYDYDGLSYKNIPNSQIIDTLKDHYCYYGENIVFIETDNGKSSTYTPAAIVSYEIGLPVYCIGFNDNRELIIHTSLREIETLIQRSIQRNLKDNKPLDPNVKQNIDYQMISRENIGIVLRMILQRVLQNYNEKCETRITYIQQGNYDELLSHNIPIYDFESQYEENDWIYICLPKIDGEGYTYYPVLRHEFLHALRLLKCKHNIVEDQNNSSLFSMYITIYPNKTMNNMSGIIANDTTSVYSKKQKACL